MPGRIRVLVAGDVYLNPSLVAPFLEDDGYEVVGEASTAAEVLPAIAEGGPDAIAIDGLLLSEDAGLLPAIRTAAPDAKVIVLTSSAAEVPPGADAALEKGRPLTALSATIGRLLGEPIATDALPGGGTADRAEADGVAAGVGRFVATVGAPILLVWTLVAALTTGGGISVPPADTTDLGRAIVAPQQEDHLDDARLAFDEMIDAIRAGRYVLATVHARVLMDERDAAIEAGRSTGALDALITLRLGAVASLLPASTIADLQTILGGLFPVLTEGTAGGGSGLILGAALGTGSSSGGDGVGGDGGGDGAGGDGSDEGSDEGEDGADLTLGPGDGREWGQSHGPREDRGGATPSAEEGHHGRGGEHRHDGGGEAGHEHGHGHGGGQQKGHGKGHDGNG